MVESQLERDKLSLIGWAINVGSEKRGNYRCAFN